MKFKYSLKTATNGLWVHKSRSILTVLGILIGIASIIMMVSIGDGAKGLIMGELSGLGAETIVIRPGQEPQGPTDISGTLFADSLKNKDIEALQKKGNVPDLESIMPGIVVPGSISYEGETYTPIMLGGDAEFFVRTFDVFPDVGTIFDETDIRESASVVVLGSKVKEELFGESNAVGEFVRVKDRKMRVVGILPQTGQKAFFNVDDLAILPYTTAQKYLLGIDYFHEILLKVTSTDVVDRAVLDIERTLRDSHGITDPKEKDDFFVVTQQGMAEQVGAILGALTVLLSSVVSIALVVGGIGIMNIMLVSVTERTKEIGLRKALGATNKDIMRQFLIEAVILAAVGGVMGIIIGTLISFLVFLLISNYFFTGWTFSFPVFAAVVGVAVSCLVGLVFGIYPARQASKKSPIEALGYE